jgi:hypothetical protein
MTIRNVPGLSFVKKATLTIAALAALVVPIFIGILISPATQAQTLTPGTPPAFDVLSVKPSTCPRKPVQFQPGARIVAASVPAQILIGMAYGIPFSAWRQGMIGAPDWVDSQCYSVEAHAQGNPPRDQDVDRAVMDRTGLSGTFEITLDYSPSPRSGQPGSDTSADSSLLSTIFTALQEQLGLKLEPQKDPVDVLVIDHVEEPSAN